MKVADERGDSFRTRLEALDKRSRKLHVAPGSFTGRALEVLLDFAELFGAVSLFDAASGLYMIADDLPSAYVGFACLCSFVVISNLHAVGSALEAFEGEYTRNWAVLGLNWTCNFCGVLLFIVTRRVVGDMSIPWLSLVAPLIQTIVLIYALAKIGGTSGKIRMFLVLVALLLMIACVVVPDSLTNSADEPCTNASLLDMPNGCPYLHLSSDCFDFTEATKYSYIVASSDGKDNTHFQNSQLISTSTDGATLLGGDDATNSSECELILTNNFPSDLSYVGVFSNIVVVLFLLFVLFSLMIGGSFAVLILKPYMEPVRPGLGLVLTIVVVFGWPVLYPTFEIYIALPRLVEWAGCLLRGVVRGHYEFDANGAITMSEEQDDEVPNRFKLGGSMSESTRTFGLPEIPDSTGPPLSTA